MTPAPAPKRISGNHPTHFRYILSAYYPSWSVYQGRKPSDLRLSLLTHVHYAFARLEHDGTVRSLDEEADTELLVDDVPGCFAALKKARQQKNPEVKIILSIGGGIGSTHFPSVAADNKKTARFCQTALDMVRKFELDGIDIDWEHPSNPYQGKAFESLLRSLRDYFPSPKYVLAAALPAGEWCLKHIDLNALLDKSPSKAKSHVLDYLNIMAYDFAGPWTDGQSGHHAQLHAPPNPHNAFAKLSIEEATRYLVDQRGVDPAQVIIGVPAYGRSFLGVKGAGEKFSGCGGDGDGTFEYRELPRNGTVEKVDKTLGAASCYGGDGGWVSYDNPETVKMKAEFAIKNRLGGVFFWTGSADAVEDGRSLILAAYNTLTS